MGHEKAIVRSITQLSTALGSPQHSMKKKAQHSMAIKVAADGSWPHNKGQSTAHSSCKRSRKGL
jgi:hypothetical protein